MLTTLELPANRKPLGKPTYSSLILSALLSIMPLSQAEKVTKRHSLKSSFSKTSSMVRLAESPQLPSGSAKIKAESLGDLLTNLPLQEK